MVASNTNIMRRLVPITQFNRGQASRIFDRLRSEEELIVLKNNKPAAVIMAPEEYQRLSEMEEDYTLLLEAVERMENSGVPPVSFGAVMADLGISEEELAAAEEPEIE